MANELSAYYPTPSLSTVYFVLTAPPQAAWNGSAFVNQVGASWATFKVAGSDPNGIGIYAANWPSGIPVGSYVTIYAYRQAGGSPTSGDTLIGVDGPAYWDGTVLTAPSDLSSSGGLPAGLGDGISQTVTGTTLAKQAGTPTYATSMTNRRLDALASASGGGSYAFVTSDSGGVCGFTAWVGPTPTAPVVYEFAAPDASSPAVLGGIASILAGGGLFAPGVVSSVTSGSVFTVAFGVSITNPADWIGSSVTLSLPSRGGVNQEVAAAVAAGDSSHVAFTLAEPFGTPPVAGVDTVWVG